MKKLLIAGAGLFALEWNEWFYKYETARISLLFPLKYLEF